MKIKSINPSNNQVLGEVEISSEQEIQEKVKLAQEAKEGWKTLGIERRNKVLRPFYDLLEKYHQDLAELMAKEMGMPIKEAREDMESGVNFLRWYSDHAAEYLSPEVTYEDGKELHTVYREPMGVAAIIVPWNFPMSNFVWQVGQNLVAGNTVVFKHSEEVILFGKKLEELVQESALPKGIFNVVHGDGPIGDYLVHQEIDMICFTGSTKVGRYLYEVGAKKFIPVRMELGGSAPGIVFADADVNAILETIAMNRFMNCGQMCDGLKRLIVHESKLDKVITKLIKHIQTIKIGDAMDEGTQLGPLVAERQVKVLEEQVADAKEKGARFLIGGKRPDGLTGAYYEPTLVTKVSKDMRIWKEEVFGPVLPIVTFKTEQEAVALANDTLYGLGGYVFTQNKVLFDRIADKLQTGMVSLNNIGYVKECNPFGGYKQSGLGREHGKYGFHDVTQIKLVSREK